MGVDESPANRGNEITSDSKRTDQQRGSRFFRVAWGQSFVDFFVWRFSAGEPFGLHLTIGVGVSIAAIAAFILLACSIANQGDLTALDMELADRLHRHAQANPAYVAIFRPITALGSQRVLFCVAILIATVLSLSGHRPLCRAWLAIVSGGLLHAVLKPIFPRMRPQFEDPFVIESSLSFPSGHAMASLIGYGLLAYLAWLALPRGAMRFVASGLLLALILGIGFSRLYLGAHYLTDVLGGYAAGVVWLTASICGIEVVRRSRK